MPKISDARRAERRQQILDAARRCFHGQGLHATSMNDIIRESGLSAGAVYGYFSSKDELILATVTAALTDLRNLFDPLFAGAVPKTPEALVLEILTRIDRFSVRDGFDFRRIALLGWAEAQRNEDVRRLYQGAYGTFRAQLAAVVRTWVEDRSASGQTDEAATADALFATVLGYVVESTVLGDVDPQRIAAGLAGLR